MKKLVVFFLSAIMVLALGCQSSNVAKQLETGNNSGKTYTLMLVKDKGSEVVLNKELNVEDNKNLMQYLRENAEVIDNGGFIKSINGIESVPTDKLTDEQKKSGVMGVDWFILVNEKSIPKGANDIFPQSNDIIKVVYKEWSPKDFENN